ncbi:transcriptional regulator, LysR family [Emticicia oligotrophica DSM 17448]|uniref:Transcriptional regulator, LysR family n=1 Tax=Emticicia oligotrophica (strain DSM 17448 / CIP 109782 / MTCC 6937 / GPTSA100-15) TaxID=929562 RepID=A0ABN4AP22_EMTOG|nr:LysR family transcriptional regulator [Emticicia oligotrophica]AFK04162.1 transcriptional regulator, LysR family [Emticicia oligotrophica DSM 17448]
MDFRTIEHFLKLTETLNFRKAAEDIYIAQPALSRQIMALEEELGVVLFDRNKRNVALTPAGEYFKEECERILEDFERVKQRTFQVHKGEGGEIKIAHSSSSMQFLLPNILAKIQAEMPLMKTILNETTNIYGINALINRTMDVTFGPNMIVPKELNTRTIYVENFVLILPQNHHLNTNNFESLAQVADENFILPPRSESSGYVESLEALCQSYGFIPKVAYQSGNSNTVLRLVEAGVGISIEPKSALSGQNMNVKYIELSNIPTKAAMLMVWLRGREKDLKPFFEIVDKVMATFKI